MSATALPARRSARVRAVPGFGLAFGITLVWLSAIVLVPLAALAIRPWELGALGVWHSLAEPRVLAALRLSFGAALLAAAIDLPLGLLLAWAIVRLRFPGRGLLVAAVDLPFALPTAVAGIALTAAWAPTGVLGRPLHALGIEGAYSRLGIVIALVFLGVPFVVRTVQPVLAGLDPRLEEAAATLGATPIQTFVRVVLPALRSAIVTGFALAFSRALGEYGSVVFISGNMPGKTEVAPLLVMTKLEQFDYAGATALALVMVVASFAILVAINSLGVRTRRRSLQRKRGPAPDVVAPAAVIV